MPNWIRTFGDPELTALVADAVARNPDLRAAAARVEASRSAVRIAAASLYPRIAMKGLGERQGQRDSVATSVAASIRRPRRLWASERQRRLGSTPASDHSSQRWVYGLGIGASWEADVWGRIRSKKAAAQAESGALEADYEFARQSLAAAVARAYFSTIEAAQQEANAQETLESLPGVFETDRRDANSRASRATSTWRRSSRAPRRAEDTLYTAQAARAQAIRAIEVVTSHYPAGKLDVRRSFPGAAEAVPAGLPAQILERRPDLIAAERRFAAAFHRVNEARTARLPRFALSATSGLGTAQLDTVGVLDAVNWSLAAGIIQPIFFGGELKAAQDIRTAEQKAAAASYVGVALRAFEDVEDALAGDYYLRKREGALSDMVSSSAESMKFGREQLDQGQTDMFTILRLAGENLAAKDRTDPSPRLPPARTRESAPRPRRRFQGNWRAGKMSATGRA